MGKSTKGGTFERDISKHLTKWLSGKNKPYLFWRQEGSGSLSTIHIDNIHLTGDIKALTPEAGFFTDVFTIECKTGYNKVSFFQHFKEIKTFAIREFWEQCIDDAIKSGKSGMLIYRKLGRNPVVGIESKMYQKLIDIVPKIIDLPKMLMAWRNNELPAIVIFDYKSFFSTVKPDHIKKIKSCF